MKLIVLFSDYERHQKKKSFSDLWKLEIGVFENRGIYPGCEATRITNHQIREKTRISDPLLLE